MSLDHAATKPHARLADVLADDLILVNQMIRARMASENAPRIPEVTADPGKPGLPTDPPGTRPCTT